MDVKIYQEDTNEEITIENVEVAKQSATERGSDNELVTVKTTDGETRKIDNSYIKEVSEAGKVVYSVGNSTLHSRKSVDKVMALNSGVKLYHNVEEDVFEFIRDDRNTDYNMIHRVYNEKN